MKIFIATLLASILSFADTPPPGAVLIKGGTDGTKIGNVADALKVTGSLAISGSVTSNQGTGGVSPWLFNLGQYGGINTSLGQKTMSSGIPVTLASDQSALPVSQNGIWTVNSTQGTSPWVTSDLANGSISGGAAGTKSTLAGGIYNSSAPTLTNGQQASLQFDVNGNLKITPAGGSTSVTQGTSPWIEDVSQFGGSNVVTGTGASGLGIPRITISNDSNVLSTQSGIWNINNVSGTISLPNGAATSALQTSGNASLTSIDNKLTSPIAVSQSGAWSVGQSGSWTVTANAGTNLNTSALALSATQTDGSQKTQLVDGSGNVWGPRTGVGFVNYMPVINLEAASDGAAVAARSLQIGGSDGTNLRTLSTDATGKLNVNVASTTITGTVAVTQSTSPWVNNISQFGGSNVVTGTGASGSGIPRFTVANDSNVLSTQSGIWNINNVSGTISLPNGAATETTLVKLTQTQGSTTSGQSGPLVQGAVTTSAPTYATAQTSPLSLTTSGSLRVDGSGSTQPISGTVTANAGTNLNTSALALSATQTNGNQKTQVVDGSGTVITSTTQNSKTGLSNSISGQDPLTGSGSGNAINATPVPDTVVTQYHCASIQHALTGTNTITFEGSNDGVTFTSIACQNNAVFTTGVLTAAAAGLFYCPITGFQHFRTRISAFTSGTSTDTYAFTPMPCDSMQKTTAINGTVPVSGTVNTNPAIPTFGSQVASAARTTTGNSGSLIQAAPNSNAVFEVNVTAVSGTTPRLILFFEESYDNGTTFTPEYYWEPITAAGQYTIPNVLISTSRFRFSWVISGTTPSFTFSIGSTQGSSQGQWLRKFIDTSLDLNTTNAVGAAFNGDGCKTYNFTANISACTLFPTVALQLSEDGTNYATPLSLPITANGTFMSSVQTGGSKFVRMTTTTGGTTCTLGYISIRCTQY